MDESKRDNNIINKTKRNKNDHVKLIMASYLQRRNYPLPSYISLSKSEFLIRSLIQSEAAKPNSVLYSCYNSDPLAIDYSFGRFVNWLKDLTRNKNTCLDLEQLIPPLFCHLYLEILKAGHSEKASAFFKVHSQTVEKLKCDDLVKDLIHSFTNDVKETCTNNVKDTCTNNVKDTCANNVKETCINNVKDACTNNVTDTCTNHVNDTWTNHVNDTCTNHVNDTCTNNVNDTCTNNVKDTCTKELFRTNKFTVFLSHVSLNALKRFLAENCHVVFLQVLQNWFDIREIEEDLVVLDENEFDSIDQDNCKFQKLNNAISQLKKEPKPLLCVHITNTREEITCAVMKREYGILAYSQQNSVHVRPIHQFDSVLSHRDCKQLTFYGHHGKVYDLAISVKNEYLVSGSGDHTVCIFDLTNAGMQTICKGHLGPVYCVAVSHPALYVASGSFDNTARLWSTDKGKMLRVFAGHSQPVTCIQFHPNNIYVATGSADRTVRLWSLEDGKAERLFQASRGMVFALAFHPLGQYIASASEDKRIHVWDILHSKMVLELKYKEDIVTKLLWSKDGRFLGAGTIGGVFRMWNLEKLQENNNADVKYLEPTVNIRLHQKLLCIDFGWGSFACATS